MASRDAFEVTENYTVKLTDAGANYYVYARRKWP